MSETRWNARVGGHHEGWPFNLEMVDPDDRNLQKIQNMEMVEKENGGRNPNALLPRIASWWQTFSKGILGSD